MQKFWKTHLPLLEPSRGPGKLRKNQSQKSRHLSFDPEASGLTGIPLLFPKTCMLRLQICWQAKELWFKRREHSFDKLLEMTEVEDHTTCFNPLSIAVAVKCGALAQVPNLV